MKKIIIFCLLLGATILSCDNENELPTFNTGIEENFEVGVEYLASNNHLKFKITEINDSRCPVDVECIWAGKADVKIEVESPVQGNIELSTFQNQTDTLGSFSFRLISITPYPVSTKTIKLNEYIVTLKILELTE